MTQDEIIEMAREAGLEVDGVYFSDTMYREVLVRFANLVAAKVINSTWTKEQWTEYEETIAAVEREACAKVCDSFQARDVGMQPAECAGAIRARGEA